MKILFFIETGGPGGAERVVLELLRGFKELGHEVSLATLRTGWLTETAQSEGFPYFQLVSTRRLDVTLPFRLAKLIRILGAEVLHTHLLDSNFYGALAARISGVRHVGTEHGDVHHLDLRKHLRTKLKLASSGRSILTSVSEYSARRLEQLGVNAAKIRVVPNPVNHPHPSAARDQVRAELGVTSEWLWFHVGNLRPVKDQLTLIRGFGESFHSGAREQRLVIIGEGGERPAIESLIKQLELQDAVRLLGHQDNVERFLSAGDGFILSSVSESMPMALLEAIAQGLFPICSSVGGIPEIIPVAQLFEKRHFGQLGALCTDAVRHPERSKAAAEELQRKVLGERGRDVVLEQYLRLYLA